MTWDQNGFATTSQPSTWTRGKNTVGSSHHALAFPWCTSPSGCASLTMLWWCKSHQRWRPVCLFGAWKWQCTVRLLAPTTTAPLSAVALLNKEASVRADPSHRLTEYTSSFSLLNQCILHHLAMRHTRASAGDSGVVFYKPTCLITTLSAISYLMWWYSIFPLPLGQINKSQIIKMICRQPFCHWFFSSQVIDSCRNRHFWAKTG